MKLYNVNARPSVKAPGNRFEGTVWVDEIAMLDLPSRLKANSVTFEPGARTAWHTHPVGQVLFAIFGVGRVQVEGQDVVELRPGDVAVIEPHERHWHGASEGFLFCHIALNETLGKPGDPGNDTQWQEMVAAAAPATA